MLKYKKINIKDKVIYFDLDDFRYVSGKIVQSDDYIEEYRICKQDRLKKLTIQQIKSPFFILCGL